MDESTLVATRGAAAASLPPLIQELLAQRGFSSPESMMAWAYPSLQNIRSPFLLKDMSKACERLLQARQQGEIVAIYGDYDLDGTSGVALLKSALTELGFKNVLHHQPMRLKEGYGLHAGACEALYHQGASVILTVDVGITGLQAAQKCIELGVDLIITDHHLPEESLPEALAVINPNQKECTSGLGHLCGTGVAFYLCLALLARLREIEPNLKVNPKAWLDMVAIATITDMVPLVAENRVLVKHGLEALRRTPRAGLRGLMRELNLGTAALSCRDVGIGIAPKLNALSRLEGELRALDLYLEEDPEQAKELVQKVLATNQTRKELQSEAEQLAIDRCREHEGEFVWVYDSKIHQGVVGLIATKLTQALGVPAFVGSVSESQGTITGSARRPDGSEVHLVEALTFASKSLVKFGGHAPAAGFELKLDQAEEFKSFIKAYFDEHPQSSPSAQPWRYDLEVRLADLSMYFYKWLEHLEPFGTGFPYPVFSLNGVEISKVRVLKERHLKFTFLQGSKALDGIWFSAPSEALRAWSEPTSKLVDVLGELCINRFRGTESLQIMVQNIRPAN